MVTQIDETRQQGNLSSAIRLFVRGDAQRYGRNGSAGLNAWGRRSQCVSSIARVPWVLCMVVGYCIRMYIPFWPPVFVRYSGWDRQSLRYLEICFFTSCVKYLRQGAKLKNNDHHRDYSIRNPVYCLSYSIFLWNLSYIERSSECTLTYSHSQNQFGKDGWESEDH